MVRTVAVAGAVVVAVGLGLGGVVAGAPTRGVGASAGDRGDVVAGIAGVADEAGEGGGATSTARTYAVPLDAPVVVARPFDAPAQRWAAGHRGVDLAAHPGQVVRAPQAGVVTFAGTVVDRGVVTVTHADGLRSSLEPVRWSVRPGQRVLRGQVVATVAEVAGHCAPATCLHWGLRRGETYLDPMRWVLDRGPVVLLPTG